LYRHILVSLNPSAAAHRALRQAIQLAVTFHANLTAVAVTPSLPAYEAYATALGADARQLLEDDNHAAFADLLDMARKEARQHKIEIATVLDSGPVPALLLEAVRTNDIDLLVLGIVPDQGFEGWLVSSTAHKLAEGATCDVLGVH